MDMLTILPMAFVGGWEIIVIALLVLLLFGGKKIPELMKGLGKGVKSFKEGMKEVEEDVKEIFMTLFIFAHGYASLLANNEMEYDEQLLEALLTKVYMGAVYTAKEAKDEEGL